MEKEEEDFLFPYPPPSLFLPRCVKWLPEKKTFPPSLVLSLLCFSLPSSVNRREEGGLGSFSEGMRKTFLFFERYSEKSLRSPT